jgi:acetylornithine aminotransferase
MSSLIWYPGHELLLRDIVRAENGHLFDSAGNRYVDLESGVWCSTIGHGNPRVLHAMTDQAARIAHTGYCYSNQIVESAAQEVLSVLGFDGGRCVFLCSGSEAVEFGVRFAQKVASRPTLMTMADSYFGAYGSASRRDENEWFCFDWLGCVDCPDTDGGAAGCAHWAAIPFDRIGGFLFEPGSSSGLVRFPPRKRIRDIVERLRADGGLYLVNEVTTGVGRTGAWFGHNHYEIRPDIVALGKSIGNGYPVSVTAFAPGVIERLGGESLIYAQSHQNDPLGAAIAREVIRTVRDEKLVQRSAEMGHLLLNGLEAISERSGRIVAIRGRGLMVAVELVDDAKNALAIHVQRELVQRGFILARRFGTSVLRIDPPLTIERQDLEAFLTTLENVLSGNPRSRSPEES